MSQARWLCCCCQMVQLAWHLVRGKESIRYGKLNLSKILMFYQSLKPYILHCLQTLGELTRKWLGYLLCNTTISFSDTRPFGSKLLREVGDRASVNQNLL